MSWSLGVFVQPPWRSSRRGWRAPQGIIRERRHQEEEEVERLQVLELARVVKTFLWLTSCCRKMRHLEVALEAAGTRGPLKEERMGDDCSWRGLGKD